MGELIRHYCAFSISTTHVVVFLDSGRLQGIPIALYTTAMTTTRESLKLRCDEKIKALTTEIDRFKALRIALDDEAFAADLWEMFASGGKQKAVANGAHSKGKRTKGPAPSGG
jgi:hypothetical protein